jgi:hypothetical protein
LAATRFVKCETKEKPPIAGGLVLFVLGAVSVCVGFLTSVALRALSAQVPRESANQVVALGVVGAGGDYRLAVVFVAVVVCVVADFVVNAGGDELCHFVPLSSGIPQA